MLPTIPNPGGILIEMGLVLLLFLLLTVDLLGRKEAVEGLGRVTLIGMAILTVAVFLLGKEGGHYWSRMIVMDGTAVWFKRLFLLTAVLVVVMARRCEGKLRRSRGAFYALIVMATLGMCLLASSNHFIVLFLALELVTLRRRFGRNPPAGHQLCLRENRIARPGCGRADHLRRHGANRSGSRRRDRSDHTRARFQDRIGPVSFMGPGCL
jgi:hypothetical protein